MFFRIRRALATSAFNRRIRGVFDTPPVAVDPEGSSTIISQLCHRDLSMYLLALKSFARFLPPRDVVVLDDGTLTEQDVSLLKRNVPGIERHSIHEVPNSQCPKGGCWERLLYIADHSEQRYIIQLDPDTLTLDMPSDVIECVHSNRSFTLGTRSGLKTSTLTETSAATREMTRKDDSHVQVMAEKQFERLPEADHRRYVRGSAGFAGFARGACDRYTVHQFSQRISDLLPRGKWSEWGSEQVASNYLIANSEDPLVLPVSRYSIYNGEREIAGRVFLHFIGSFRFHHGTYGARGQAVVAALREGDGVGR